MYPGQTFEAPKCITMKFSVGFKFSLGFGYKLLNTLITVILG